MIAVTVHDLEGQPTGQIEVQEEVFGVPAHEAVVHQALTCQLANRRLGTASTKTRGEVAGSTRKLFPQKHTGRARQGPRRAPHRRGGGVAFGPHPRDYHQRLPKKMRLLAIRSTLSQKLREGEMVVVEDLNLPEPKTQQMAQVLGKLGARTPTLLVTGEAQPPVVRAARNLPEVRVLPAPQLNVLDLVSHRGLVMTVGAVKRTQELWGREE